MPETEKETYNLVTHAHVKMRILHHPQKQLMQNGNFHGQLYAVQAHVLAVHFMPRGLDHQF
jgi:hypothetical protein